MLDYSKSFIETQFPISKISKESYKERKANLGQTITGLGKWWGRKPLILVRATLLGVLLPVSDNPKKDRDIFLKLLTMDEEGLLLRKTKSLSIKEVYKHLSNAEREQYFERCSTDEKPVFIKGITKAEKESLQVLTFNRLTYDEKIAYCDRPEHVGNLSESSWKEINNHLETSASNLKELVNELGIKRYGEVPKIGDCFAGGGSIPFEASRIGAKVFASDLNPISTLLTWAGINISGAQDIEIDKLRAFQQSVYDQIDAIITEWGIEHNEEGHRADSYLYCHESICPECNYKVPLAPSWIIGKGTKTVAILEDNQVDGFEIKIIQNASKDDFLKAEALKTVKGNNLYCPHCKKETPITVIRRDKKDDTGNIIYGLRKWSKAEFLPKDSDVFQERLYCIRYVKTTVDDKGNEKSERYFKAPNHEDILRENKVKSLLYDKFNEWQEKGFLPSQPIESGFNNDQPIRERGWSYWHQLFNPRQLLLIGLFNLKVVENYNSNKEAVIGLLGINKIADYNSKLSRWHSGASAEKSEQTFYNQALNTIFNYGMRALPSLKSVWFMNINNEFINSDAVIQISDARDVQEECSIWITDPPYADAVNYHELTEFFMAWDKLLLNQIFPHWSIDSKRALAVKGTGESFNISMIEIYKRLAEKMPDNGTQVVMFTHQDVKIWAELAMVLWSAGLRVVSAWNIATETESGGLKNGNFVKGTVLLVLKKQLSNEIAFQDELYRKIKREVQFQIDSMRDLDDKEDPNFTDTDYSLASYASSLKVLTNYKEIEGIDVQYELSKIRNANDLSPIEELINKAVKIANDYLIPEGIDNLVWRDLKPEERFYIRGLVLEMENVYQISAYQELARGIGVRDYQELFENFRANTVRLKTASEYKNKGIDKENFGKSLLRHILVALYECRQSETTLSGINYLKAKYDKNNEYWDNRAITLEILKFISRFENITHLKHWHEDARYARLLKEAIKNDGI